VDRPPARRVVGLPPGSAQAGWRSATATAERTLSRHNAGVLAQLEDGDLRLARPATTRRASTARGGSFHGRRCGTRSGTRWLREGRACLPREPYRREPVVRPGRTDSTGGTGHRIVSARSAPSASGLRSAARWDARKRQSSQSVNEEERRACARYFRWPPFPAGQPPVRGRFACAPRASGPGRAAVCAEGNQRSLKE
jgi:hypothetical protein